MARPSKVDRLPAELRDMIGRLREQGCTIAEIFGKLRELDADVGRSGLAEYLKRFDVVRARLHNSRAAAEQIMARFEDQASDDRVARMNIAHLHASVMELMAGADGEPVTMDPKSAKLLSETLRNLATAAKSDQDRLLNLKKSLAEQARAAVDKIASEMDGPAPLDGAEVLRKVREDIYGIFDE